MKHFGAGGLVDYILSEIAWIRYFGRDIDHGKFIGEHKKGEDDYDYEAPFHYWDKYVKDQFHRAVGEYRLKSTIMELR